ncbi:hypothetical protein RchiOBHm_Chr7g0222771 [Rosa chinensis]|uniref:Uncharacterized protein n=1 Tax=Rosa chinensis TaxID=74649 RepID=A0A2P6PDD3_ROSCH|nr:hypothetical protein RchiOBHm_Chr7g0222771 [Rosa chinensis]
MICNSSVSMFTHLGIVVTVATGFGVKTTIALWVQRIQKESVGYLAPFSV